jgi:anti-sigma factor RsiW
MARGNDVGACLMRCEDAHIQLSAAADGELDAARAVMVHDHLETCPACRAYDEQQRVLSRTLRGALTSAEMPPGFAARMRAGALAAPAPAPSRRWMPRAAKLTALAASWAVAAWLGMWVAQPREGIDEQIVAAHVRSMQLDHLVDVPSSDRHTVKPWFAGKLSITPPVVQVDGYELLGGRLDWIAGKPAASIVYRRRAHTINVFASASVPGDEPMHVSHTGGWNLVRWRADGVALTAVSDLNANELIDFAHALGAH